MRLRIQAWIGLEDQMAAACCARFAILWVLLGMDGAHGVAAVTASSPGASTATNAQRALVKPIVDGMQDAHVRLKRGETGDTTRTVQERVIHDLAKLIEAAERNSRSKSQPNENGSQEKTSQAARPQAPAGSSSKASSAPGETVPMGASRPSASKPTSKSQRVLPQVRHPLLREVWGHLPPGVRERVPSNFGEAVLPAYDDLVRRYFEALLDDSGPSGRSGSASADKPAPQR